MKIKRQLLFKLAFSLVLLFGTINMQAQTRNVTGAVTDASDGTPLLGAYVELVNNTSISTITDIDGNYKLTIPSGAGMVLEISYMSYKTKKVTVTQNIVNVQLEIESTDLGEVMIIGYGTQKKTDRTGAVSLIKANELNGGVLTDPIQGLQGKTAGVSITKKGGDPNGGFSVKIRGASGLYSGTEPLYVIDGVPGVDPTTIAAEDIESFNVLKDASSTAIYGARGANGVIIITTKKGTKNAGNHLEFNSYFSLDNVANRLDLLTGDELRTFAADHNYNLIDGGANTDWQNEIYRQGLSQSYNVASSGGDENSTYRVSLSHTDFEGVVIGSSKERTVGRINLSQTAIDGRLVIQTSLAATIEGNDYIDYAGSGSNDVLYQAFQRNPTDPVMNADGESYYELNRDFNYYNPVALANQIQNQRDAKRYFGSLNAKFEIIDGLKLGVNLGYTRNDSESFYFEPTDVKGGTTQGYARRSYNNYETKLMETTLSYDKVIQKTHTINAVTGYSFQEDVADGFWAQGNEPLSDYVMSHNLGVLNEVNPGDVGSYKNSNRLISMFGRVVYNFNSKYYVTATLRRDGSSKFGLNNEWGVFPSGSIAWNIKQESFLKNVNFIQMLKLRAGFGLSGNQEIGSYNDIMYASSTGTTINPETGEDAISFALSHNSNPNLKWEENSELNIGIDFGLFNNRISGSVEYYNKHTYDLLAPYAVPVPPNAVSTTWANAGEIENKGFELNLQIFVVNKTNFDWKANASFSTNRQEVVSLSSQDGMYVWTDQDKKEGWLSGRGLVGDQNWTQLVEEGYALGSFYMPEYAGLSADGKFLFHTAAGGVTREVSNAERRLVGVAQPDFELSLSNYLAYKNFDLSFSLRAVVGHEVLNVTRMVFSNPSVLPSLNALAEVVDEVERGLTDAPKVNSYYLEDGTFLRMDNLTFGYNFDVTKVKNIQKARVYFASNNLFVLTNYTGIDPEISYDGRSFGLDQYNVYPKTRTFTFGVNLTF